MSSCSPLLRSASLCSTPNRCCSSTMTSPRFAKATLDWNSACVPTATAASPPVMPAIARERSRIPSCPERETTRIPSGSSQARKFVKCCSASSSVGAMRATWRPLATAVTAASAAITVLPDPTSPCTIRCIGRVLARSARTCAATRRWAGVRSNGREATKRRANASPPSSAAARRLSSRRLSTRNARWCASSSSNASRRREG